MRIGYKIFLVGGFPIAIAAAIAVAAVMLLGEADRARSGAILAGAIHRNVLTAVTERDRYVDSLPGERDMHSARFAVPTERAEKDLATLRDIASDGDDAAAIGEARQALVHYVMSMGQLETVTQQNDMLIAEMAGRASRLIELTDEARQRQHDSNADIVAALSQRDRQVRDARDLVEAGYALRSALSAAGVQAIAVLAGSEAARGEAGDGLNGSLRRLRYAVAGLSSVLRVQGKGEAADELEAMAAGFGDRLMALADPSSTPLDALRAGEPGGDVEQALTQWAERLLKVYTTQYRALHDEMAELLTYSVKAHETEQATQNIAIAVLKLGDAAAGAFKSRSPEASAAVLDESRAVADAIVGLPISPLIQTDMIDAFERWREGLSTTTEGLRQQNALIAGMDAAAERMTAAARTLDQRFTESAEAIGRSIRTVLILGAAIGLVFGAGTAAIVARSIVSPLKRLQLGMLDLAGDPHRGRIEGSWKRDELGDMARATNVFVGEILRREHALRRSKDRADQALAELRRTQAELIQAEKLASLGQLVAGVAHEINTPLGIALTTSTVLDQEVSTFRQEASSGRLARASFDRFTARMEEGSRLLLANLRRAADLVHAFKQVAADQASGERRSFELSRWLEELLTSLGPMLRKGGHEVVAECPEGLEVETYPGALAQVLTNLVTNAITHGYGPGERGTITIRVRPLDGTTLRIVFADDGRGIPAENRRRVFDPFFTTGRGGGSTGLGLHIVYNLVTSTLNGRLDLESEPGHGTRFTIDLPLRVAEAVAEPAMEEIA
ncbi:uncharacterized protein N177_3759 [Lutibaculum baratangense AMV1]|uniref:histidine kinase n=2 Tax=Lutibaculum TaxID=1358438 RepID=V4T7N2_9HYPH|nr:uncharacterized protein N177_3759 [Lutibaculum baratangense AMV1]